jgi:hypothetical protein
MGGLAGGLMGGAGAAFDGHPNPQAAADAEKLPDTGPMSRAVNAGLDGVAAKLQASAGVTAPEGATVLPNGDLQGPNGTIFKHDGKGGYVAQPPVPTPNVPGNPLETGTADNPAARAQREADRPPDPAGDILPGDITTKTGKPFKNMTAAMGALAKAGGEATHELVPVAGGLVVRAKAPNAGASNVEQPDMAGTAGGTADAGTGRTSEPVGSGVAAGRVADDAGGGEPGSAEGALAGVRQVDSAGAGAGADGALSATPASIPASIPATPEAETAKPELNAFGLPMGYKPGAKVNVTVADLKAGDWISAGGRPAKVVAVAPGAEGKIKITLDSGLSVSSDEFAATLKTQRYTPEKSNPAAPASDQQVPAAPASVHVDSEKPTEATLPSDLAGAKPGYSYGDKRFTLNFASDLDKAAYIAAQKEPSKRDADYVKHAMDVSGMTEQQVREHGAAVRAAIKAQAKDAKPGELTVPEVERKAKPEEADPTPAPKHGMTRLYHGSATHGRYDGKAWFSTDKKYAHDYRDGAELQYVDYPTAKLDKMMDPDGYGQTAAKGFTGNFEFDSSETGLRKPFVEAAHAAPAPAPAPKPKTAPELPMGQEPGGEQPTVQFNGKDHVLTHEQKARWDAVNDTFKAKFDEARARFDAARKIAATAEGLAKVREVHQANQRQLGTELAAQRRAIVGQQEDTEVHAPAPVASPVSEPTPSESKAKPEAAPASEQQVPATEEAQASKPAESQAPASEAPAQRDDKLVEMRKQLAILRALERCLAS